jgi:adenylate cyclase, class 2
MNGQEIEVKFYLADMAAFRARVAKAGAGLVTPRVHELNLRFDTPERTLTRLQRVLRLRKDERSRITYKGPAEPGMAVAVRQEIEFEVSDFEAARQMLAALGYEVSVIYEKFRTTFRLETGEVVLDELPYGNFVEIEAPDSATVQRLADSLNLNWEHRITDSYLALFERLKANRGVTAQNLSFSEIEGTAVLPEDLGVQPGDR